MIACLALAAWTAPARAEPTGSPGDVTLGVRHHFGRFEDRRRDTRGPSLACARIGIEAHRIDRDTIRLTGMAMPRRRAEMVLAATCQAVAVPGFTVQPDVQVVFHPGGGTANPRDPNRGRVRKAAVLEMHGRRCGIEAARSSICNTKNGHHAPTFLLI